LFPYLSREDGVDHACKEEEKRIEAACEPDPGKHWTEKHCPDLLKFKNNDPLVDSMKELEKLADILPTAPHFLGQLPRQQLLDRHKELLGNNPLTDRDGNPDSPSKLHGDAQELLASLSDCLRARKCNLVPYKTKTHFRKVGSENVETTINQPDPRNPRPLKPGCCPGQTGHHLIPSESLKRENGKKGGCKHYDHNAHNAAPTVCVESAFQHSGTHKRVHHSLANIMKDTFIKRQMKKIKVKGVVKDKRIIGDDKLMTMTDMIEFAVESHQMAFPLSACSEECIRAQLKDFYKKCIRSKARMVKADGTAIDANETVTY
ncbi:MAG TPA: HNH/endonuclease VII fold toxin-2 domain-containing protein, partial [Pseudoxanthomonas sp.]|nr:HNH/endonuclease VII fold toxin-2 domain-containing protein [Pseudoxanthomonas sp.]